MNNQNLESSTQVRVTRSGISGASKNTSSSTPKIITRQLNSLSNNNLMTAIMEFRNQSLSSNNLVLMSLSELNNKFQNLASLVSEFKLENASFRRS